MRFSIEGCIQPPAPVPGSQGCLENSTEQFPFLSKISGEYSELKGKREEVIYLPSPQVSPMKALGTNLKIYPHIFS